MRTLNDAIDLLGYHPATPEVAPKYARLRQAAIDLASDTWDVIPDGPEKTLAMRALHQWLVYANLAVALTVPLDLDTPHVARVMPPASPIDVGRLTCHCGAVTLPDRDAVISFGSDHHGASDCELVPAGAGG